MAIPREWAFAWLAAVSIMAAALTAWDKSCARRKKWRVPERTLWLVSLLGGSAATCLTMCLLFHKTLHRRFMWGLPLLMLAQAALVFVLWHEKCLFFT